MKRIAAFCHSQQLTVPIIFFVIFGIWQFVINEWSWDAFWRNPWTSSFPYLSTTLVFLAVQIVLAARDLNRQLATEKEADKPLIIGVESEPLSKGPVRVIGFLFVLFVLALEALALHAAYPNIPLPAPPAAPGPPQPEPSTEPTDTPAPRRLTIIFKDSPYFTESRKKFVTDALEDFYGYLTGLGFDIPVRLPPLGVNETGSAQGGTFPGDPVYDYAIGIDKSGLERPLSIREAYATYWFGNILHTHDVIIGSSRGFDRGWMSEIVADYYSRSSLDIPPDASYKGFNGPRGTPKTGHRWTPEKRPTR